MRNANRLLISALACFALVFFLVADVSADLTQPLSFTLRNSGAEDWVNRPITSGVALPAGEVTSTSSLIFTDSEGREIPVQVLPTAYWPDGSLKWVLLDFRTSLRNGDQKRLTLDSGAPSAVTGNLSITQNPSDIQVAVGDRTLTFNRNAFSVLGREFQVVSGGTVYRAVPFAAPETDAFPSPTLPWLVEESGPLKIVLRSDGEMRGVSNSSLTPDPYIRYRARIFFYSNQPWIRVFITLKNNQSWDWPGESDTWPRPDVSFSAIRLGAFSLVSGQTNLFGAGLEKTWQVELDLNDSSATQTVFQVDPANEASTHRAEPLLFPDPADTDRIRGFGEIVPPLTTADNNLQEVWTRYEKTLLAKVAPEAVEDLQDGSHGNTLFDHIAPQLGNYKDYGDLSWGGGWSRNHYDWIYGMDLHWLRTGDPRYVDASVILAKHQADLDVYHTWLDGDYFDFMNEWEGDYGSHNNPDNSFGGGRPSHTWNQGYMLHWLLTGDRRCLDAALETLEGARRYLYLARLGYENYDPQDPEMNEVRVQGWLSELFMVGWLTNPSAIISTGDIGSGTATYRDAVLTALESVVELEAMDGQHGYILLARGGTDYAPLQMHYVLEPLIKAYDRLLRGTGDQRETEYRDLIYRIVDNLRANYIYGDTSVDGYRPLQIFSYLPAPAQPSTENPMQTGWLLKAANAAAYVYRIRGDAASRDFARQAFRDYMYYRETGGAEFTDPNGRVPTSYHSLFFADTESKMNGWCARFGQYYLRMERELGAGLLNASDTPTPTNTAAITPEDTPTETPTPAFSPTSTDTPIISPTPTFTPEPEDVNRDGHVDELDLYMMLRKWHRDQNN